MDLIKDHYPTRNADRNLFNIISTRVSREHSQDRFSFDLLNMRIKLLEDMRDRIQREKQVELELLKKENKQDNQKLIIY